jgi:uroporphyrinogen decarboxylase
MLPNPFVEKRLHHDLGTTSHRELLEQLNVDVVDLRGVVDPVYRGPVPFSRHVGDGVRENFWGWRQKIINTATGPEDCFLEFKLAEAESVEDLERHEWPTPDWFDFSGIAYGLREWDDFAIMASGPSVFQHPSFLRGIENLLMDMAVRPEMASFLMDKFTDFYVDFYDRMLTAADGRIDIVRVADDLGTQNGLFFSPAMAKEFVLPRVKRFVNLAHSHGAKLLFHSCGAIRPVINDIIDIGVDILDPLQAAAEGMEPQGLKDDYGDRVCLHGGICTQHLLPKGKPEEVWAEALRRVEICGKNSGFILSPCHVLQTDVPTENILALSEVVCA